MKLKFQLVNVMLHNLCRNQLYLGFVIKSKNHKFLSVDGGRQKLERRFLPLHYEGSLWLGHERVLGRQSEKTAAKSAAKHSKKNWNESKDTKKSETVSDDFQKEAKNVRPVKIHPKFSFCQEKIKKKFKIVTSGVTRISFYVRWDTSTGVRIYVDV